MSKNQKFGKNYGPYFRADLARFYGQSPETFRRNCIISGLAETMPQILDRKNKIFYRDKAIIEAYLGPSRWGEYIGEK